MALASGTRIGPYEVVSALGSGGMGEVYRAHDTKLSREVALKILPAEFAADAERLARFKREAQVLASLNHSNIGHIYGFQDSGDTYALVLELVEGPTLAERIARGPIPIEEALPIAEQIADALEAAHEQGIVHRDLKPANIKLRSDGTVKVLDFGLAKVLEAPPSGELNVALTNSPTITTPAMMTGVGTILGTAAYMSPEQAKGKPADKRSDIWAFGCVLYEMLSGRRAFEGEEVSDTIAEVLKSEPDWSLVSADVPTAVRTLMQRCLAKDRRQRVSEMATARFVLTELASIDGRSKAQAGTERTRRSQVRLGLAVGGTAMLGAVVVGAAAWALRPPPRPSASVHFSILLPADQRFAGATSTVAISPDGTRLAYAANARIFVRSLDDLDPREIAGSAFEGIGGGAPMFSPDGQSIAFFVRGGVTSAEPGTTLSRIPIGGGVAEKLSTVDYPYGGTWGLDGILIGQGPLGVVRVPAAGGTAQQVIKLAANERAMDPQMLPDGRTVLFTLTTEGENEYDAARIVAQSLVDGTRRILRERASNGRYANGHLWYLVGGRMFVMPFDVARLTATGSPINVVDGVQRSALGVAELSVSDVGMVVYRNGPGPTSSAPRNLVIADTRIDPKPLNVRPALFVHPRVSPDGRRLAVGRFDGPMSDVWVYDLTSATEIRRLTFDGVNRFPVWSADGQRITFQSAREGDRAIWWGQAGGGTPVRLTRPGPGEEHVPECWSRDGRRLLLSLVKNAKVTLWVFTLDTMTIEQFGKAESTELFSAAFSPDGRWIAYGATPESTAFLSINRGIYVEPFPATGERHQAPKQGLDYHPVWAPDGRTIYYVSTLGGSLVAAPFVSQPSVIFGTPTQVAHGPRPGMRSIDARGFDMLPDGRFVSLAPVPEDGGGLRSPELRVINWSGRSAAGTDSNVTSPR